MGFWGVCGLFGGNERLTLLSLLGGDAGGLWGASPLGELLLTSSITCRGDREGAAAPARGGGDGIGIGMGQELGWELGMGLGWEMGMGLG